MQMWRKWQSDKSLWKTRLYEKRKQNISPFLILIFPLLFSSSKFPWQDARAAILKIKIAINCKNILAKAEHLETCFVGCHTERKNVVILTSKVESLAELKLTWDSKYFYTNILQLLGIPGRILVPSVTQFFRSKWLNFFFQCSLSLESRYGTVMLPYLAKCLDGNSSDTI